MFEKELEFALKAASAAKEVILKFYKEGFHVEIKEDNSPVTEADKNSDEVIRSILSKEFPHYAFLTEESNDDKKRLENDFVWIIDPLDGTKDFVKKDDEFTINIALAYKHEVVLGVVCAPALDVTYYGLKGVGAFKVDKNKKVIKIHVNNKLENLTCLRSIFHFSKLEEETIAKHQDKITKVLKAGSSLKACLISEGKAEISYRLSSGTKEWDTAAFQIIVEEAGGFVLKLDKTKMYYNREDVYNRDSYIIINRIENFLI